MSVGVTEKAATEVQRLIKQENLPAETAGLKVGVKGGGCSGFSYSMALAERAGESDQIYENCGIRIFVDAKSYLYLAGTELDYQDGLMGRGFVFNNPNAQKTCGCGSSFGV